MNHTPPAFQFYAAKFLAETSSWSAAEVGAYVRLLSSQWVNGWISADVKKLGRTCGLPGVTFKKLWGETLSLMFEKTANGTLINRDLEDIRETQRRYRESLSIRGKAGAEKRWDKDGEANA